MGYNRAGESGSIYGASTMRIQPMVAVKKAAALLGVDKADLRAKLSKGELAGERKVVGEKEKWFIYSSQLDMLLDGESTPKLVTHEERTSLTGLQQIFEDETPPNAVQLAEVEEPLQVEGIVEASTPGYEETRLELDEIVHALTIEFAHRLAEEYQTVLRLRDQLQEKELVVQRLAPMEKALQFEVKQGCLKELEIKNLRAHVEQLQQEVAQLKMPWWKKLESWFTGEGAATPEQPTNALTLRE
jgi:hypothetical protein